MKTQQYRSRQVAVSSKHETLAHKLIDWVSNYQYCIFNSVTLNLMLSPPPRGRALIDALLQRQNPEKKTVSVLISYRIDRGWLRPPRSFYLLSPTIILRSISLFFPSAQRAPPLINIVRLGWSSCKRSADPDWRCLLHVACLTLLNSRNKRLMGAFAATDRALFLRIGATRTARDIVRTIKRVHTYHLVYRINAYIHTT